MEGKGVKKRVKGRMVCISEGVKGNKNRLPVFGPSQV